MDAFSSQKNSQYNVSDFSPIVADELNAYASECFLATNRVEKYFRFSLLNKIETILVATEKAVGTVATAPGRMDFAPLGSENMAPGENPFIDEAVVVELPVAGQKSIVNGQAKLQTDVQSSLQAEVQSRLQAEIKLSEPANVWTAPIKYKKATATSASVAGQSASHAMSGCICDECAEGSNVQNPAQQPSVLSIGALAPLACCTLLLVCSLSLISHLILLGEKNCSQAKVLCDSGKYQEALTSASLAVRCNPFSARSYYERGRVLLHMLGYREAEECLHRCLSINPDDASALDARAALSLKIAKPAQTISDTTRLMALNGNHLNAFQYGNMAVAFYKFGRYEDAIKYYDRAMASGNNSLSLGLGRTYCLSGKQQHKQALAACNALIKEYGSKSQILVLRGYCLQRLHELAAAQNNYDQALAEAPSNPTYYGYRAALLTQMNKPAAALADLIKAASLDSHSAQAQYAVAKLLKDMGRNKEALAYYDRLALCPSFQYSYDQHQERIALNYAAGNYQACLADLKRAIELKPSCDLRPRQALCLAHLGQASAARASIAAAYQLSGESASLILAEAQVDAILGQSLSAVDKYSKVLLTAGDNREALRGRGQCYFDRAQWASAAADFKRALALGVADNDVKNNLARCERVLSRGAKISIDLPAQKIVDMTGLNSTALMTNGRKAYQEGDLHLAAIYFVELVKREPANLNARKSLAHSLAGAGSHQEAIAVFEPLSQRGELALNDQYCYAHALAAAGVYKRSIAIMQRLQNEDPNNMNYRLELAKMFSAAGQIDKAIVVCRDSLAMRGSSEELKSLNNVYESLVTERLRSKKDSDGISAATSATRAETEG